MRNAEARCLPDVDIIISNLHAETAHCLYRAVRPFPVEALLYRIMRVVYNKKLEIDSLTATQYTIRVILSHELTVAEWEKVVDEMANGIWDQD